MLNQTEVLRHIERELGFLFVDLELSEDDIINTINKYTIPVFSKFAPRQERIKVNENDLVEGYSNIYYLDTETPIVNINRVIGGDILGHVGYTGAAMHPSASVAMGNPIESQMLADLRGQVSPRTYRFHHPNKLEFLPGNIVSKAGLTVITNSYHPEHLGTIPNNMQEHFLELATYDVKMSLYPLRNRFANLQTTFGSIELFIDDLQSARDERKEFIERLEAKSLFNSDRRKLFLG